MTLWKHVCLLSAAAVFAAIPIPGNCTKARSFQEVTPGIGESDGATVDCPGEAKAERPKIIGKGAEINGVDLSMWGQDDPVPDSKWLEHALKNPESHYADDELMFVATRRMDRKQYERAAELLDIIIRQYPNSAQVDHHAWMIKTLPYPAGMSEQEWQARKAWARHVNEYPNFTADQALRYKALICEELDKRAEAIKLLEKYVKRHPQGRWATEDAKVQETLKQSRFFSRSDELIFLQLAWLYYDSGQYDKARGILTQAIKIYAGSSFMVCYHDLLALTYQKTDHAAKEAETLLRNKEDLQRDKMTRNTIRNSKKGKITFPHYGTSRLFRRVRLPEEIDQRLRELQRKEAGQPKPPPKADRASRDSEADSTARSPNETDTDRTKIVGKSVYTWEELKGMPGFPLLGIWFGPDPKESDPLEFARNNPESELADDVLLRAAEGFFVKKEYDQAIGVLDTIIERYPYSAHMHKGVFLNLVLNVPGSASEITEEKEALSLHVREHPGFTADKALRDKALICEELDKRAEAIKLLQQYVEKHPRGRWAVEDTRARPRFRSFSLKRTDELIFHHLAWLYHQSGNHIKAGNVLTQAIKNFVGSPYTVSYYDLLARTHEKTGDATKEIDALKHLRVMMRHGKRIWVGFVGGPDPSELLLHERWYVGLKVRPPEKVDLRLRELKPN